MLQLLIRQLSENYGSNVVVSWSQGAANSALFVCEGPIEPRALF